MEPIAQIGFIFIVIKYELVNRFLQVIIELLYYY
jgi:hypothetical protein